MPSFSSTIAGCEVIVEEEIDDVKNDGRETASSLATSNRINSIRFQNKTKIISLNANKWSLVPICWELSILLTQTLDLKTKRTPSVSPGQGILVNEDVIQLQLCWNCIVWSCIVLKLYWKWKSVWSQYSFLSVGEVNKSTLVREDASEKGDESVLLVR